MKPRQLLFLMLSVLSLLHLTVNGQNKYGNLQLQVSPTTGVAAELPILAIDKDLNDTTKATLGPRGDVVFNDLYVSGTDGIYNSELKSNSLKGLVDIYNLQGQKVSQVKSVNGLATINVGEHLTKEGIYFARDENNKSVKFFFGNHPVRLGESTSNKFKSGIGDSNLYEIIVDGTGREFDPFLHTEGIKVYEGDNFGQIVPSEYIDDNPAAVTIQLKVGSTTRFEDAIVTFYLPNGDKVAKNSRQGRFVFTPEDGIGVHPFDKFAREYTLFLSPRSTEDWKRFAPQEYQLSILGESNQFVIELEQSSVPTVEFIDLEDGWELPDPGPEGSSGLTMNPQDHTLWIIDFFDDYIFHYDTNMHDFGDGISIPNTAIEGGTYDTTDDTFWLLDAVGDSVVHYTKTGQRIEEDSFEISSLGFPIALGIAFDPTDNTLWVADQDNLFLGHFDRQGNLLPGGFTAGPGINYMRGLCFDPRDSTLVVLNCSHTDDNNRINKINPKTGSMVWQSSNLNELNGDIELPEGIVFDDRDSTFWFHDLSADYMYHIKEK